MDLDYMSLNMILCYGFDYMSLNMILCYGFGYMSLNMILCYGFGYMSLNMILCYGFGYMSLNMILCYGFGYMSLNMILCYGFDYMSLNMILCYGFGYMSLNMILCYGFGYMSLNMILCYGFGYMSLNMILCYGFDYMSLNMILCYGFGYMSLNMILCYGFDYMSLNMILCYGFDYMSLNMILCYGFGYMSLNMILCYGFGYMSLNMILCYLSGRKHRTKVNNRFSEWADILSGVPQGSILGPLFFNIYINDLFYFIREDRVTNYADDTTPYDIKSNYDELIDSLQSDSNILLQWFTNNFFKLNADKCKLLISNREDELSINIEGESILCQSNFLVLKLITNRRLTNTYLISVKKVSLKLHALARVSHFMNNNKLRLLVKAFIESQFSYCSLIWMFHSRMLNNRINNLHERALRLVNKDNTSSVAHLLERDRSFSIHSRNSQKLAIEMFKVKNNFLQVLCTRYFQQQKIIIIFETTLNSKRKIYERRYMVQRH